MQNNIQITKKLFFEMYQLILDVNIGQVDERLLDSVETQIKTKIDAMIKHDLYTTSKTAETEQEREDARQKYLDQAGIHKDFRY